MTGLKYSLVIGTTEDPNFFSFYSPDLEGFSGLGRLVNDCLVKAQQGIDEHLQLLAQHGLKVPPINPNPVVTINDSKSILPAA